MVGRKEMERGGIITAAAAAAACEGREEGEGEKDRSRRAEEQQNRAAEVPCLVELVGVLSARHVWDTRQERPSLRDCVRGLERKKKFEVSSVFIFMFLTVEKLPCSS